MNLIWKGGGGWWLALGSLEAGFVVQLRLSIGKMEQRLLLAEFLVRSLNSTWREKGIIWILNTWRSCYKSIRKIKETLTMF